MVLEELLAPAGSYDVLVIAVNAGADAVYIAGQNYGARAYAKNFTMEEIEKVLNHDLYCDISEMVYDGLAEVQEASFMAGFSQCAKIMSNGKIDFMPNEQGGGYNE